MILTYPTSLLLIYPKLCRHCLCVLVATIHPYSVKLGRPPFWGTFTNIYTAFTTGRESQGTLADTSWEGEAYKNGFLAFLRLIGTIYFKSMVLLLRHHHQQTTFKTFQLHIPLYNSNTKTGWKTYSKILQIVLHLKMTWSPPMKPSTRGRLTRTAWFFRQSLSTAGQSVTTSWLLSGIRHRICKQSVTESTYFWKDASVSHVAQLRDVAAKEKNTHCSEGCQCINCLNMPSTEGAEDHDLSEIALEEEVTADITWLDTDTDELIDWVFGADMQDTASVEDDDEVVA